MVISHLHCCSALHPQSSSYSWSRMQQPIYGLQSAWKGTCLSATHWPQVWPHTSNSSHWCLPSGWISIIHCVPPSKVVCCRHPCTQWSQSLLVSSVALHYNKSLIIWLPSPSGHLENKKHIMGFSAVTIKSASLDPGWVAANLTFLNSLLMHQIIYLWKLHT